MEREVLAPMISLRVLQGAPISQRARRTDPRLLLAVLLSGAVGGCAASLQGMVESSGPGTVLVTQDGRELRLVLGPEAAPLAELDGLAVELEGERGLGAFRVSGWRVVEGPHGMPTWVGALEPQGSQIGIADRNSGAYYLLDAESTGLLWEARGKLVIVEGYVSGPHRVHVLWWQEIGPAR